MDSAFPKTPFLRSDAACAPSRTVTGEAVRPEPTFVGKWNNLYQLAERGALERAIAERDGPGCFYCGSRKSRTIDHVTPVFRGGSDALGNLVFACRPCNWSKLAQPGWIFVFRVATGTQELAGRNPYRPFAPRARRRS